MKFSVERASFLEAVSKLQKVVSSKTSLPVLEGILISVESGRITMASYNLEMGMKKELYAKCEEEGDIVINARLLSDILRKMNGVQVEIETDEKLMCHLRCGEAVFDIMGMAASDFPEMPSVSDGSKLSLPGEFLIDMVKGTNFAVAQIEGTRPILTGINFSVKDGVLQMVAIDGYRLAIRRQKVNINNNLEFIVAGKAINEAVKLIEDSNENVDIIIGKRLVSFNIEGYLFISRLIEGEFVKFEKIIPVDSLQKTIISRANINDIVERISLLINDNFSTPIRFAFSSDSLVVSCATAIGRAKESLNISLEGESFEIGLNSRYLLDVLRACEQEKILFKFNGANSGVIISPADENDNSFLYLIMPMRLK